jgi:hypothetical protein
MDNPWATDWPAAQGTVWLPGETSEQDEPQLVAEEPRSASVSPSPPRDSLDPVPETTDAILRDEEDLELDEDWAMAWGTTPASETKTQPPDKWEAARQEKEKLNAAVVRHLYKRTLQLIP